MVSNNVLNFSALLDTSIISYINTNVTKVADIVTPPNVAVFTSAVVLNAPSLLPATTVNDFNFFINNQHIPSSLVTLVSNENNVEITFDTNQVGFTLVSSDEVIAIGKFQQ
jgi:hypothetical protein